MKHKSNTHSNLSLPRDFTTFPTIYALELLYLLRVCSATYVMLVIASFPSSDIPLPVSTSWQGAANVTNQGFFLSRSNL